MNKDQQKVAVGALSGIALMLLSVAVLYFMYPSPVSGIDAASRIAFALQLNVFAAIPLFVMIASVGNARFLSKAIDPLRHAENNALEIDGRVVDNTLQQNFIFLIGTTALATLLPDAMLGIIPALVTVFVLARVAFWVGYRMHPLYRAPGMAATSYMNLFVLIACAYIIFTA